MLLRLVELADGGARVIRAEDDVSEPVLDGFVETAGVLDELHTDPEIRDRLRALGVRLDATEPRRAQPQQLGREIFVIELCGEPRAEHAIVLRRAFEPLRAECN